MRRVGSRGTAGQECRMRNAECRRKRPSGLSFCIRHSAFCIGIGLVAVATAGGADNNVNAPVGKGLLSGLFHEKPRTQGKKDKAQVKREDNPIEDKPEPIRSVESSSAEQQRYVNALIRRMEVCDRLRMVALQTGNETLMTQANELEDRANEVYRRQTAGLPLAARATPSAGDADKKADERTIYPPAGAGVSPTTHGGEKP
jgi:hypothetical protein